MEPQNKVRDRIQDYKRQITDAVNKFDNFLENVWELEEKHEEVMKSTNNEELMNRAQTVKEMVDTQKKAVDSLQTEINEQFGLIKDRLVNLLQPEGSDKELKKGTSKQTPKASGYQGTSGAVTSQRVNGKRKKLKSMRSNFVSEEEIWCLFAVYNSNSQQILFTYSSEVIVMGINSERNNLLLEHTLDWKEVRRDESDWLCRIAMTSDNTLYAVILNKNDKRYRVSVLRQSDLREEREIDTSLIKEQRTEGYRWVLRGCGNRLAIVTILHNDSDKVYRWECVYIYSEERCTHRVTLDIERDYYSFFSMCYIGSHLIVQTSGNRVAVVSLDERDSIQQKETEKKNENKRETKSGKSEQHEVEERRATHIKHITLMDTRGILDLVWLAREDRDEDADDYDEVEEGKRQTQKSAQGYLFVGDNPLDEKKCSVFELDLDRVKDGDSVNSRKDLQMNDMFPKCMIDKSNIFAIKRKSLFTGNPSIVALEFH